jgi:hypothetical protein
MRNLREAVGVCETLDRGCGCLVRVAGALCVYGGEELFLYELSSVSTWAWN